MKTIQMEWKQFNINLDKVLSEVKILAPGKIYGISSDVNMRINCSDDLTLEQEEAINDYLNSIDEQSNEATSYRTASQVRDAIKAIKAGIPSKSWNQLSSIERALLLGIEPTALQMIEAELL